MGNNPQKQEVRRPSENGDGGELSEDARQQLDALIELIQEIGADRKKQMTADIITIGDYEYSRDDQLGKGAFGVVYKGKGKNGQAVAIKKIETDRQDVKRMVRQETKILSDLKQLKHANLVELLDLYSSENNVYIVTEFCNGGDLHDFLKSKVKLGPEIVRCFANQLVTAMYTLNGMNLIHRDLKPLNILIINHPQNEAPYDKQLKVADFGLARYLNDGSMAATVAGTRFYIAPEVLRLLPYDHTCDLYSIGIILFELVTGLLPFDPTAGAHANFINQQGDKTIVSKLSNVETELKNIICSLIKIEGKERLKMQAFFQHDYFADGYFASWKKFQSFKSIVKTMASEK